MLYRPGAFEFTQKIVLCNIGRIEGFKCAYQYDINNNNAIFTT